MPYFRSRHRASAAVQHNLFLLWYSAKKRRVLRTDCMVGYITLKILAFMSLKVT